MTPFTAKALAVAVSQLGVREDPPGSNRGAEVDRYVRSVGLNPEGKYSWCAAYVYFCFDEAAKAMGIPNPLVKTGGVLDHWHKAAENPAARRIAAADARLFIEDLPGTIFIMAFAGGLGHTGLVESVSDSTDGKVLVTIEGNTNIDGSREGIGVFRRKRLLKSITKGFIDYSNAGALPPLVTKEIT